MFMNPANRHNRGFSLTEVLLAVAVLSVGMVFVAGTYAVGVYYTTVSAERTVAAVVADEAFAKIRLFGLNPNDPNSDFRARRMVRYEDIRTASGLPAPLPNFDPAEECGYPSVPTLGERQYWWSALCRGPLADSRRGSQQIQVTVFVCRKVAGGSRFEGAQPWPTPMRVQIGPTTDPNSITVSVSGCERWISEGATIVDDASGRMYRVLKRNGMDVWLDRPWQSSGLPNRVWVVPPPVDGGRDPCIAVYQKLMRF